VQLETDHEAARSVRTAYAAQGFIRRMKGKIVSSLIFQPPELYPAGFRQDRLSSEHAREAPMREVVRLGQQMQRAGLGDRLGAAVRVKLAVDALELGLDGINRDHEVFCNLRAGHSGGKQPQNFQLPFR
jgi:hypothetical protein